MPQLISIIIACFSVSLCVLVAIFLLLLKKEKLVQIKLFLISLSAGVLMGGAFLHLLPEAAEQIEIETMFLIVLLAFIFFFAMEKYLHWRHCHEDNCPVHTFAYINLLGDGLHNFIDGLVIAGAFLIDTQVGIATTLAIIFHEVPQELGDFGVLIHAGFEKKKALIINYLVALTVVLGGIVGYFLSFSLGKIISYLLPFAAGGFIYIAASDLLPEIRKETIFRKSVGNLLMFVMGIGMMFLLRMGID